MRAAMVSAENTTSILCSPSASSAMASPPTAPPGDRYRPKVTPPQCREEPCHGLSKPAITRARHNPAIDQRIGPRIRGQGSTEGRAAVIRLQNVGLKYGRGSEVLRDVTFHLKPGSFHFLTGPSGAGKSSLLRL